MIDDLMDSTFFDLPFAGEVPDLVLRTEISSDLRKRSSQTIFCEHFKLPFSGKLKRFDEVDIISPFELGVLSDRVWDE